MEKRRILTLDIAKGIAIYLVVLGHSIQYMDVFGWKENLLMKFIYSFHMPLFFFISGYLFYSSSLNQPFKYFVHKKFERLLLPSITFGITMTSFKAIILVLKQQCNVLDIFPDNWEYFGLWFLNVLFITTMIGRLVIHLKYCWHILACISLLLCAFPDNVFYIRHLRFLLPFFIIGIVVKKYNLSQFHKWHYVVATVLLLIGTYFFRMDYCLYFLSRSNEYYWNISIYRFILALSGIVFAFGLSRQLQSFHLISSKLTVLGITTLPIYAISTSLFTIFSYTHIVSSSIFASIFVSLIITTLSYYIYKLLAKSPLCAYLLFGNH